MSTDTLTEVDAELPMPAPSDHRRMAVALMTVLVVLLAGAITITRWPEAKADVRTGTTLVTPEGLAARYGIDVNLIGVTAAGGLIEFRYQVVDPDKADKMIHDPALLPAIVIEDTGETLVIGTPHHHVNELELGGTYFFLLANAHNAVHDGSLVTLVIGDSRIEHFPVQG